MAENSSLNVNKAAKSSYGGTATQQQHQVLLRLVDCGKCNYINDKCIHLSETDRFKFIDLRS
jgi:hypothetical protein